MDVGGWIKQNKLAAAAIAAGAGFMYLSHRGSSGGGDSVTPGQLVPVAAAYPMEESAPFEEAAQSAQSAAEAADQAAQVAQDVVNNAQPAPEPAADIPVAVAPNPTMQAPPPAVVVSPTPSPPPTSQPTIQKYSLPGGYTPGTVLGYGAGTPPNLHMLIGNVLGYKMVGSGQNSNGSFNTFRFYSDIGATGDWNFYYAGPKKMTWVGPFNLGQRPGG